MNANLLFPLATIALLLVGVGQSVICGIDRAQVSREIGYACKEVPKDVRASLADAAVSLECRIHWS
jgi:hypothetical protein